MLSLIREIRVDNLFGRYNYFIPLGGETSDDSSRMSLLYGDNGTGKTTILRLVFHLLSSAPRSGHKTVISEVPFSNLTVTFSDLTTVSAHRSSSNLIGNFDLGLSVSGKRPETVPVEVDPESGAVTDRSTPPELDALLGRISKVVPDVFYLGDDRTIESDTLPRATRRIGSRVVHDFDDDVFIGDQSLAEQRERVLKKAIDRARQQIYVELTRASTRGEVNARQIYAEVLRSIVSASVALDVIVDEKAPLEEELREIEEISQRFAEFGLGSAIDTAPLKDSLSDAAEQTLPLVLQVLKSFLNGQRARLDAHDVLYEKMHAFVATINGYLTDKIVELHVSNGLTIRLPGGELDPSLLSSGERHLLLLFLNVFTSSNQSRLFIIDEPELSLNVKWQRELVDSLLGLTQNSLCQFLLATHSIELLSKHKRFVTQLKP